MFGGLDRADYNALGDGNMGAIRVNTNLRWVGFYLTHHWSAAGSTFTARLARVPQVSTWRFLRSEGWGRAPLFMGRQFVGVDAAGNPVHPPAVPHHMIPNSGWSEANGRLDARHAIAVATSNNAANLVDIEAGATIYIDLENDGFMSNAQARSYLGGWFSEIAVLGYRPGTYCSFAISGPVAANSDGPLIRAAFPDVAIWFFRIPLVQPSVYDEAQGRLTIPPASDYQDAGGVMPRFGYVAYQYAWYNSSRAIHGARLKTGPASSHNVAPIDFDGARFIDPAHPEDRVALAFTSFRPGEPAAVALEAQGAAWQHFDGQWGAWGEPAARAADTTGMADLGYGRWFDSGSVAAVSRRVGLLDIFGVGIDGSVWTAWRSADQGQMMGVWSPVPQVLNPALPARPGSTIAAVSRKTDVIDMFFINRDHELTTTWWTPTDSNWQGHVGAITHGFAFAPATPIEALVAPADPERLDLFAVDWGNGVRWVQWRSGMPWETAPGAVIGGADPALGVAATWHAGALHLVAAQRDGTLVNVSHASGAISDPAGWTMLGALPTLGAALRPMGIKLLSLGDALVLVGVVSSGRLFWNIWNGLWSPLPGFHSSAPAYSTSGRLAAALFDATSIDVMLPNHAGDIVMRRLTHSAPFGVPLLSVTHQWTMIF